jgi:tRNA(fMet)-specific endonuclease VapC
MKFLLDTDHISILQRRSEPGLSAIRRTIGRYAASAWGYSIISFQEQFLGCHKYIAQSNGSADLVRGYEMLERVLRDFSGAIVLPFDLPADAEFHRLRAQRVRIGTMDLRIASIALSRGLILVTRNAKDFSKVPGLLAEDWTV